ncbi:OmpW family protein [Acidisoma cellulosilytica]|uniref:OmpW family protein n=1 Tax=Acidisoma cellulosilyticum TaxID=2802395 RepID=A0A963Z2D1_9PROT|nr:OmpW family outer membrane protein [Acidisoma cellulosilyticum]MCB8881578.1 OmpW family protein [Acidisoma cellulosilyticum]
MPSTDNVMEDRMKRWSILGLGAIAVALLGAFPDKAKAQTVNPQQATQNSGIGFFSPAPSPLKAGTFETSLSVIGVIPETFSSSISPIGGNVNASGGVSPELTLTYFLTNHWALQAIAASTHHRISAGDTALGHVDVGNAWVLPPTLTLQYHFLPDDRFSPYLGLGVTVAFFYASDPATPTVQKFSLSTTAGPTLDIGFDYNIADHWFVNVDAKQMFINTTADIDSVAGRVKAKTALNPTVFGVGFGYRF